jgi:hypothetical protein
LTLPAVELGQRATRFAYLFRSPWAFGPMLGIALGLPVLGGGGRIAMRVIAHATNVAPSFSIEGTITVLLMGAVSGAAGGLIYAVLARLLPTRQIARALAFAAVLILLTLRGTSPSTPVTLSLFLPVMLVYGTLFHVAWQRRYADAR